ncbi:MAG TPA: N-acetylmuramoyl-L-alanine amidase [Candidatus Limnocylindria bacterium]|nr:N-acetylmuramoyl-L-alanine amidase [Candidatus Limnocylindria bacterium]
MPRRRVLGPKRLSLLIALLLLGLFPHTGRPAVAAPRATGEVVANERLFDLPARGAGTLERDTGTPGGEDTGATGEPVLRFTSATIAAGQLFDRVGARWTTPDAEVGESLYVEVRTSADAASWSEWIQLPHAEDLVDDATSTYYAPPWPAVDGARYAQFRVWLTTGDLDSVSRLGLTFLDVTDRNAGPLQALVNDLRGAWEDLGRSHAMAAPVGPSKILTRRDWAADESLMRWAPRYQRDHTMVVVHHTVTGDGGTNVAAEMRSIYYFHAVTRGWGDIGYHYLVDKFGNIWTGRQGGDHVEGGHAYGWNNGAFSVSAIGDYQVNPPTSALQGAIANVVAVKFAQYGLQPYGQGTFTHQERRSDGTWIDVTDIRPKMIGHRDANYVVGQNGGQTACPGNTIAAMMDGLRRLAQNAVTNGFTNLVRYDPALPRGTFPGSSLQVPVLLTNRGTLTIPAGTFLSYQVRSLRGETVVAQGGRGVVATALPPGASMSVNVPFGGPPQGQYMVKWDLQTTGGAWWNQTFGTPVREQYLTSRDWSADWISDTIPPSFTAGETRAVTATLLNDGGRVWPASGTNPVRITYSWTSIATGNTVAGANKMSLAQDVQPGQSITVTIPVTAPLYPTNYTLRLDLEKENEFKFGDRGIAPDDTSTAVLPDYRAAYQVGAVPALAAGASATVPVTVTNAGRGILPTTTSNPIRLGYHWVDAQGRNAVFEGSRTVLPADLAPGASVQLQANVTAPQSGGTYTLKFDLVHEGVAWFSAKGVATADRQVTVEGPAVRTYGVRYEPQATALAVTGQQSGVPIVVTNSGNWTWPSGGANPVNLAYHWWSLTTNRTVLWEGARTTLGQDVAPGASVNLSARVVFPATAGTYLLRWDLVEEGVSWFSGKGVATGDQFVRVEIPKPFTYGSSMLPGAPATMAPSVTASVPVKVQNLGQTTWDATVNLSYHWYDAAGRAVVWEGLRTPLDGLAPGDVREVSASVATPSAPGTYTLRWDIVREGHAWFSSQGVQMPGSAVEISAAAAPPPAAMTYAATYAPQLQSVSAARGATVTVPVMIVNSGTAWQPGTVNVSYHLVDGTGATVVWDGLRTALAAPVAPNTVVTVALAVKAPATAGTYTVRIDLVHEGVTWFSGRGVPSASVGLTVQ